MLTREERSFATREAAESFFGFPIAAELDPLFRQPRVDQRTNHWHKKRNNVHTGSRTAQGAGALFPRHYHQAPLTSEDASKEKPKACDPYKNEYALFKELTTELNRPFFSNYHMDRGTALEDEAAAKVEEMPEMSGWRIIDFGLIQHVLLWTAKSEGGLMPDFFLTSAQTLADWAVFLELEEDFEQFECDAQLPEEEEAEVEDRWRETRRALGEMVYMKDYAMQVSGVTLDDWERIKELRWMAYSPDGLLVKPNGHYALLEIKVPTTWPTNELGQSDHKRGYSVRGYSKCIVHPGPGGSTCDTCVWTNYQAQVQWGMYLMRLERTYFLQYSPPSFQTQEKTCVNMVYPNPVLLGAIVDGGRQVWGDIFAWRDEGAFPDRFRANIARSAARQEKKDSASIESILGNVTRRKKAADEDEFVEQKKQKVNLC